jgi:uncharacterized protein
MPKVVEQFFAFGNVNVQSLHPSTLMFTKDAHLSLTGDCVVAVAANKAGPDFSSEFKAALQKSNAKLTIQIEADGTTETIRAQGSPKLTLTDPFDLVVRKSDFICSRTLAIKANKSSKDLSKELVKKLMDPKVKAKITLTVEY